MASFEKVNYTLRPGKAVERKMLCECFRRLSPFARVDSYRYVGFGSIYFSDFSLIHRSLGIDDLVSIEREDSKIKRFEFNRPYRSIELKFGESTDVLPELDWSPRTIMWLDYDQKLNDDVLADVATFCRSCTAGSVLVVSVNAKPDEGSGNERLKKLKEKVGSNKVPSDVDPNRLAGWEFAEVNRRIIAAEVASTLSDRNGALQGSAELRYKQLFNFNYQDGVKMMTTGGLVHEVGQEETLRNCGFDQLDFVRERDDPCEIMVPNLTFREMRHIDSQLPVGKEEVDVPISKRDVEAYRAIYRYFPTFVEAEL